MERVQKVIANSGYCSRRKAEELIVQGKVKVNNQVVTELGTKVGPRDLIEVEGHSLEQEDKEYILLNKPRGIISSTKDDKGRKTVIDLIQTNKRLYPVGRLDYDTTGILLITNDGELTNLLMHPANEVKKLYVAKLDGIIDGQTIKKLEKGIEIDGLKTAVAKAKIIKIDKKNKVSIVQLLIHEGKNHQVKKMFNAVGFEVLKLKREKISFLNLDGVNSGDYRHLNPKEVKRLYNEVTNKKE